MKAARLYGVGDLRVEDIPAPPPPAANEVRLRIEAAGICGSDLHNFATGQWISRTPVTPGHELAGVVVEAGAAAAGFEPGDCVVADSRYWCGECGACREGRRHLCERLGFVGEVCDGGFAEQVVLPARLLHKVAPGLDPRVAVMAEPLAVALHAVRRLACERDEPALIVGCGTIGGLAALLLTRMHRGPVLVADRNAERLALVARVTGARPIALDRDAVQRSAGGPLRRVVEATGSVAALRAALACVDPSATVALVGIFHETLDLDPNALVEKEISLVGCHAFQEELPHAIEMLASLAPFLVELIDAEIGLDAAPAAYARLASGAARGLKTIVRPER